MFRKITTQTPTRLFLNTIINKNCNNPESQAYIAIAENLTLTLLLGSY